MRALSREKVEEHPPEYFGNISKITVQASIAQPARLIQVQARSLNAQSSYPL